MSFRIPSSIFGKPIDGAIERALNPAGKPARAPATNATPRPMSAPMDIDHPENWIILEGRDHAGYKYNNLLVCMHRLGYSSVVETAAKSLGLNLLNTSNEKDGTPYIGSVNWEQALSLNSALGNLTLNPRQGLDLFLDLEAATSKNAPKKLYDARGHEIALDRLVNLKDEIWEVRAPYRAEWLDARFVSQGSVLTIQYGHNLSNRSLVPNTTEPVGKYIEINGLMDVKSANKHGLATQSVKQGPLYFYYPVNGSVARFYADSGRAGLYCGGDPQCTDPELGVRAVRAKN